jgi:hypothetical protein
MNMGCVHWALAEEGASQTFDAESNVLVGREERGGNHPPCRSRICENREGFPHAPAGVVFKSQD